MKQTIANYLKAGYSGLFITSFEEARVQSELRAALKSIIGTKYHLHVWTCTKGIVSLDDNAATLIDGTEDPLAALDAFDGMGTSGHVLLMQDFHLFVAEPNPVIIRRLKESLALGKGNSRCIPPCACIPADAGTTPITLNSPDIIVARDTVRSPLPFTFVSPLLSILTPGIAYPSFYLNSMIYIYATTTIIHIFYKLF